LIISQTGGDAPISLIFSVSILLPNHAGPKALREA